MWTATVPASLEQWAISLLKGISAVAYGTTWLNGTALARKDFHTWTHRGGQLVTGICIPGITIYAPLPAGFADPQNVGDPLAIPNAAYADAMFDATSTASPVGTVSTWAVVGIAAAVGGTAAVAWLLTRPRENPLRRGSSQTTFRKNVAELRRSGYPERQALAIAYRQRRAG